MYSINFKTYYSIEHLKSSCLLIEESEKIENSDLSNLEGIQKVELSSRNKVFVTGTIFSIIAFLEACINEFLSDISLNNTRVESFPTHNKNIIKDRWNKDGRQSLERWSKIKKYQKTLELLERENLMKNQN